jgi:hypothetical protein
MNTPRLTLGSDRDRTLVTRAVSRHPSIALTAAVSVALVAFGA